jgi:dienelactone hydrolase
VPKTQNFPMPTGGYPAIVLVHGGAGQVYTDWIEYWTDKGYVAIALDIFSNMLDDGLNKVVNPEGGPTEYQSGSLNDSVDEVGDSWVYHNVCNIIRCNNILRSFENVNPNQIGITGISWGGVLTCITSGVDKRFAAFAPVYGVGYLYEDSKWRGSKFGGSAGSEDRDTWIEQYDPSAYLPYATKPMFFVSGVDDNCFSVVSRVKSYNLVPAKKFYSQRSDLEHGYFWDITYEIYSFMEHILRGEDTVIKVETAYHDGDKAYIKFKNSEMVESLKLVYTTSTSSDSHYWTFMEEEIPVTDGVIEVDLPEEVTAFTFECSNMSINTYFKMSSEMFLLND